MDQMEDMKRLLQQVLLLPAAAWCRLATTGVYRPPDCPSIVDRTSSIHSFFLPDVHPAFPLTYSTPPEHHICISRHLVDFSPAAQGSTDQALARSTCSAA